jgi:hypothetical protein
VPYYIGKQVYGEDTRCAEPIEQTMDKKSDKADAEGIVYIMADGSVVHTRQKEWTFAIWRRTCMGLGNTFFRGMKSSTRLGGGTDSAYAREQDRESLEPAGRV